MIRRPLAAKLSTAALVVFAITAINAAAFAHIGDHSRMTLAEGLAHPFTGLDHILAMVAVGLWASQLKRPACWLLPMIFPTVMALGATLSASGFALPWIEPAIAGSVIVFGAVIAFALRPSLAVSTLVIALFALFHGYSHGVESPAQNSIWAYSAGFILATLALHAVGFAIGAAANRAPVRFVVRTAGAAIAAVGVLLLAAV